MATFFGEIILPSSRAFFDDGYDSDSGEEIETKSWSSIDVVQSGESMKQSYDVMIVSEGQIARDFARNYLTDKQKTLLTFYSQNHDDINLDSVELSQLKRSSRTKLASLDEIQDNILYLDTSPQLDLLDANKLLMKVSDWFGKCKQVTVITSLPSSDYKCETPGELSSSFVKSLFSSACQQAISTPRLEPPNFISGFAASVLSWCEIKKIKCAVHVCYSDSIFADSKSFSSLVNLFREMKSIPVITSPNITKNLGNPHHLNVMYQ